MKHRISHSKQLVKHQYYYTRYHYVNETEFEMFREKQTPHACMSYFIFLMQMIFSHVISAVNEAFSYKTACFIFRAVLAESSRNHQCHCETEFVIVHFFFFQDACSDSACVFPVLDIRESTSTTT